MHERLVLCGGAERGGRQPSVLRLQRFGPKSNVDLKLQDISRRMVANVPDLLADLLDIATYVLCADEAVSRGGDVRKGLGADWRRCFRFVIPVRVPHRWSSSGVAAALIEVLTFLTEDEFTFEFEKLRNPPSSQAYLDLTREGSAAFAADEVVLFSGGVDSLAGAIEELASHRHRIALVSHQSSTKIADRQRFLAGELRNRFPGKVLHIPVRVSKDSSLRTVEYTQRSRAFLFAALAAAVASMMNRRRIRFYENGVVSFNLPIATQLVGTQATRTTHPRVIRDLSRFLSVLQEHEVAVDDPFVWKTKSDVAKMLGESAHADLFRHAVSCSRIRSMTMLHPHCGTCFQCVDRRFAALDACLGDNDPAEMYAVDLLTGKRKEGFDRTIAESYVRRGLEFRRITEFGFISQCIGEVSRGLFAFPDLPAEEVLTRTFNLHKRHGESVYSVLTEAVRAHASELVSGTLSKDCLLRIAIGEHGQNFSVAPIEVVSPPAPKDGGRINYEQSSEIILAVDESSEQVLIRGLPPIAGKGNYALVSALLVNFLGDRDAGRMPSNFRYTSSRRLAAELSVGEHTLRRRVSRFRKLAAQLCEEYLGFPLMQDAIIESKGWQGYRLNPNIRAVAAAELGS
jgi:7-cyano-7-deazaguanine synthase in queuosine biosynthesis